MSDQPEIVVESSRLVDAARRVDIPLRVIGGVAVKVHSPGEHKTFLRDYPDIDLVARKREGRKLRNFFHRMGYLPDKQFNLLNGGRRQIYYDQESGRRVDVFVGDFEMCHKLPLKNRLEVQSLTVPLAELLLSKTQIVELNRKDALDILALLLHNDVGYDDDGKINLRRIALLCIRYWGLYKTTTINLMRVEELLLSEGLGLAEEDRQLILRRIERLRSALKAAAKPLFWKIRDQLGTRLRWYAEVEEVDR